MTQRKLQLQFAHSVVPRYGFAVAWVAIALAIAFFLEHHEFHRGALPLFLLAVALSAWYGGVGPAMLAIVLSILSFDYYFAPPFHSLNFTLADVPAFFFLLTFGALIAGFIAVRRSLEAELLQARDKLEFEVAARTQQASLLNLTHDTIFVRDMQEVITYWNRGAEELYGWRPEQAIGKSSHELLRTVFPSPLDDIQAEFLRTGRWEGELKHTKADGTEVVVSSRWSLRRDEQEQPVAVLETNNDITVRKRREQEIESLNQELAKRSTELEAINKELEAFAYSVSHDLRAPLRHMAGFAELLRNSAAASLNEKSRRYLTVILEAANRMGTLIDDLLAFSRISRAEAH